MNRDEAVEALLKMFVGRYSWQPTDPVFYRHLHGSVNTRKRDVLLEEKTRFGV